MPCSSIAVLMQLNFLSLSMCLIRYLLPWYVFTICCIDLMIVYIISAVPKWIALDVVIMKGILLIYMMSSPMVTLPCVSSNPSPQSHTVRNTNTVKTFHRFLRELSRSFISSPCAFHFLTSEPFLNWVLTYRPSLGIVLVYSSGPSLPM